MGAWVTKKRVAPARRAHSTRRSTLTRVTDGVPMRSRAYTRAMNTNASAGAMWAPAGDRFTTPRWAASCTAASAIMASARHGSAPESRRGATIGRNSSGARTSTRKITAGSDSSSAPRLTGWSSSSGTTASGPVARATNSPAGVSVWSGSSGPTAMTAATDQARPTTAVIQPGRRIPARNSTSPRPATVSPSDAPHARTSTTQAA